MLARGMVTTSAAMEVVRALPHRGIDIARVLASSALSSDLLKDETQMIPLAAFTSLLEAAASEAADPTLGLELGRGFRLSALGPITALVEASQTFGHACFKFAEYFDVIQTNTRLNVRSSDRLTRWSYSIVDPAVRFRKQDAVFSIAMQYKMLKDLAGTRWAPCHVELAFSPDGDLAEYARSFPCPVRFGARESAIVFQSSLLNLHLHSADLRTYRRLDGELATASREHSAALSFSDSVEDWLMASLTRRSSGSIVDAAAAFGMSLRSFQRLLAEYDVTFLGVRNKIRIKLARLMLAETEMAVTSIALQLGYSETSAFCRWFKDQVGIAPSRYRAMPSPAGRLEPETRSAIANSVP